MPEAACLPSPRLRALWHTFALLAAALLALGCSAAQAAPIAIVTDLQGQASVQHGGTTRPMDILDELGPGDEVAPATGARVVITYLRSGDEFTATGPARLAVGSDQLQARSGAAPSRRASAMAPLAGRIVATGGVGQGALRMRATAGLALVAPVGPTLLAPARFQWRDDDARRREGGYAFELVDRASGTTLFADQVQANEVALPFSLRLEPGRAYVWKLAYRDAAGARQVQESAFRIAERDVAAQWERLRPSEADVSELVLYAALLADEGFASDAATIWRQVAQRRPQSAGVAALAQP